MIVVPTGKKRKPSMDLLAMEQLAVQRAADDKNHEDRRQMPTFGAS
jgi:hypothetical protein